MAGSTAGETAAATPADYLRHQRTIPRRTYTHRHTRREGGTWGESAHKIDADRCNPRRLWQSVDVLLGRGRVPANSAVDAESFNRLFTEKVSKVRSNTAEAGSVQYEGERGDVGRIYPIFTRATLW